MDEAADTATLIERGRRRMEWIGSRMRLLADTRRDFAVRQPFRSLTIGVSLHLEPKTAILLQTLRSGGATIVGTGNYGSTQDDIVAALSAEGMRLFGHRHDTLEEHRGNVARVVAAAPDILLDNGADLAAEAAATGHAAKVRGATEETTSGGDRLRSELEGRIPFPVIVINDSPLKQIGENEHAVGQSIVESLMRITNLMINGRRFVVVGYGWCGRGIAHYLRAFGGRVAVAEVDPIKRFEAALAGYRVAALAELAAWGEIFVTATGRPNVLGADVIAKMRSGAVLANSGHFPYEIDVPALKAAAVGSREIVDSIVRYDFADGRHVLLVADGRMVNLAGIEPKGNSIESMDLGFMLQALSLERVTGGLAAGLVPGAQPVPADINRDLADRMVAAMGSGL
jgi:adenosylhomocysteinase